jgi:hypothetical protein
VPSAPTKAFLDEEVERRRSWFAFYAHDALVADRRGDLPQLAFLLGQMVEAIVAVAAARQGALGGVGPREDRAGRRRRNSTSGSPSRRPATRPSSGWVSCSSGMPRAPVEADQREGQQQGPS